MRLPSLRNLFGGKDPEGAPPRPDWTQRGHADATKAKVGKGAGTGGGDEGPVHEARVRARRRLMGALVLLAVGVVGFPVLFETQPRPLPVDTPILVSEGAASRVAASTPAPPALPPDAGNEGQAAAKPTPATPVATPVAIPAAEPRPAAPVPPAVDTPTAEAAKPPPAKPEPVKAAPVKVEAAKPPPPAKAEVAKPPQESGPAVAGRFVVQVGAYNDAERLRAARQKVEKLGYKSYTQDVDTPTGKRTRVRVGPFASRQEAETVASKVKSSGLQANILAL
ncbi:MAG: SPOR domain-containing protein [Rubrivivax sp.]|nr:SPOR domain-containing protein [Rubrivivax sp.]